MWLLLFQGVDGNVTNTTESWWCDRTLKVLRDNAHKCLRMLLRGSGHPACVITVGGYAES